VEEPNLPEQPGRPISYEVLERGTAVYSSEGEQLGSVAHVLAAEDVDIFEGIVIVEHRGRGGHRFVDAEVIADMYERAVMLKLDRAAAERLPEPSANPAVMHDDPTGGSGPLVDKLRRAWDHISGNY
jgi:uncharacterized protein YrrD